MVEAGVQAGYPRTDDLNGYQQEGFGPMDRTVTPQGRRSSTARGYLDMAKGRDNLTIITHAMTNRILFNRNKAIGVEYFEGQNTLQPIQVFADREVLLCAGAIASPQILQRSGVGPAELLKVWIFRWFRTCRVWVKTCKTIWKCTYNISAKTGQLIPSIKMV